MPPQKRSDAGFTNEDRANLNAVLQYVKKQDKKIKRLEKTVKKSAEIIDNLNNVVVNQTKVINDLHCHVNTVNYRLDAQGQYNRRESVWGIKLQGLGDDPVQIMMDACKFIEETAPPYEGNKVSINLQPGDIHRCHFMGTGDKKKLICKFTPAAYHKKMKLMLNKRHLNQVSTGKYKDFFIVEDLTPMRSHLLWYLKQKYKRKYHKFHTRNGVIKFKEVGDDSNKGPWKSVENPDDLHALVGDANFDPADFNNQKPPFKILPILPIPNLGELPDDDEEEEDDGVLPACIS